MSVNYHSRFPQIEREIRPRVAAGTRRGAEMVMEAAKGRVPVRTGALKDAIHIDFRGDADYAVVAGNHDVFYGHMVEHGTAHSGAHPFLVPALEERKAAITALVALELKRLR